jgi:hypothetical protein
MSDPATRTADARQITELLGALTDAIRSKNARAVIGLTRTTSLPTTCRRRFA